MPTDRSLITTGCQRTEVRRPPECDFAMDRALPAIPAAATAAVSAAAAAAVFTGPCLVDFDGAASDFLFVQTIDGCLCFLLSPHFDKTETFRSARVAVHNDLC